MYVRITCVLTVCEFYQCAKQKSKKSAYAVKRLRGRGRVGEVT